MYLTNQRHGHYVFVPMLISFEDLLLIPSLRFVAISNKAQRVAEGSFIDTTMQENPIANHYYELVPKSSLLGSSWSSSS